MRISIVCLLSFGINCRSAFAVPAPTHAASIPDTPADELDAAKTASAKHGAEHPSGTELKTEKKTHIFQLPNETTDADLKKLPEVPFRFVLVLQNCPGVTDAGLKQLKTC